MPIYEFRCTKCGRSFDVVRPRAKAGDPAKCPDDGARGQRLFTSSIVLPSGGADFDFGDMPDMSGMGDMGGMGDMADMDF